jgi:hypothetical protein
MHETEGRKRPSRDTIVEEEIAQLRYLDVKGLRVRWRNAFGKPAPEHLTRYLLFRIIAYRLQADRFGDLDAETVKVLARAGAPSPTFCVTGFSLVKSNTGARSCPGSNRRSSIRPCSRLSSKSYPPISPTGR